MIINNLSGKAWRRSLSVLGGVAGAMFVLSAAAMAGECPADKRVAGGKGAQMVNFGPQGVTDTVLATIDLAKEPAAIKDRSFRLRRLVIQPNGIVPWHSHDDRPALIYIIEGEVTEYSSTCSVPIVHKAGEIAPPEAKGTAHWWKNTGSKTVVLISADLLPVKADAKTM